MSYLDNETTCAAALALCDALELDTSNLEAWVLKASHDLNGRWPILTVEICLYDRPKEREPKPFNLDRLCAEAMGRIRADIVLSAVRHSQAISYRCLEYRLARARERKH